MRFSKVAFLFLSIVTISINQALSKEMSLEEVLIDIKDKIEKIESYKAEIEMVFKNVSDASVISGSISYVKPDKIKMVMGMKGKENTSQSMYSDGSTMWQYMPLFKIASKVDLSLLKEEFENTDELMKNQNNIGDITSNMDEAKFIGLEDLSGEEVYVIEGLIKESDNPALKDIGEIKTAKAYISSKDGMQRKMEYYDASGKLLFYQAFNNVEINIDIPDQIFNFVAPEGVNILDTTPQAREMLKKSQIDE